MNLRSLFLVCGMALCFVTLNSRVTAEDAEANIESVEERRLLAELKENRQQVEDKKQELQKRELELNILQDEVDKKLEQLEVLRQKLEVMLVQKKAEEQVRIEQLSQMYNRMDPARAAQIILELDTELAVGILEGMKARSAGAVLENMGGEKAAEISKAYSTLNRD